MRGFSILGKQSLGDRGELRLLPPIPPPPELFAIAGFIILGYSPLSIVGSDFRLALKRVLCALALFFTFVEKTFDLAGHCQTFPSFKPRIRYLPFAPYRDKALVDLVSVFSKSNCNQMKQYLFQFYFVEIFKKTRCGYCCLVGHCWRTESVVEAKTAFYMFGGERQHSDM